MVCTKNRVPPVSSGNREKSIVIDRYLGDLAMLPFLLNTQVFVDFGKGCIND